MYTKKVMQHFLHPHNMGEIKDADGIGKAGNIVCGDVMWIYIKIENKKRGVFPLIVTIELIAAVFVGLLLFALRIVPCILLSCLVC